MVGSAIPSRRQPTREKTVAGTSRKTPLLLVPGMLCSPRLFAPQVAALADVADIVVPDRALLDEVMAMCGEIGVDIYKRQEALAAVRTDRRPDLPRIACPTLVVCGRDDAATPLVLSQEIAEAIAGSELAVIEQCGHLTTLEKPEQTNALLRGW